MGDLSLEEVRQKIRAAFPPEVFSGIVTECDCDECVEISDGMRFKSWVEISDGFLDANQSLPLLTAEAYVAFLPAHLMRGLDVREDNQDNTVGEFAVYDLCPNPNADQDGFERSRRYALSRRALMNDRQVDAIRAFLTQFAENDASLISDSAKLGLSTVWLDSAKRTGE